MSEEDLDKEIEALKIQMAQALALYHKSAGALQFAEFLKNDMISERELKDG